MKFIRAFWGNLSSDNQKFINEIKEAATNKSLKEIVYVWGDINYKFIKSLGYECVLVSSNPTEEGIDSILNRKFLYHKYIAIKLALKEYNEIIFLDWDVRYIKQIDDNFYKKIKEKNSSLQLPLYTFPNEGYLDYVYMRSPKMSDDWKQYSKLHYEDLKRHGYDMGDYFCSPCTCFIYCSDINVIENFVNVGDTLNSFTEEAPWAAIAQKNGESLNDWILNKEPLVCNAKYDWHFNQKEFNEYMSNLINKDLYFIHQ